MRGTVATISGAKNAFLALGLLAAFAVTGILLWHFLGTIEAGRASPARVPFLAMMMIGLAISSFDFVNVSVSRMLHGGRGVWTEGDTFRTFGLLGKRFKISEVEQVLLQSSKAVEDAYVGVSVVLSGGRTISIPIRQLSVDATTLRARIEAVRAARLHDGGSVRR